MAESLAKIMLFLVIIAFIEVIALGLILGVVGW